MMQCGLTLTSFLERAGKLFPRVEVVSRLPDNSIRRSAYADLHNRAHALAASLQQAGLKPGDRVATLMWNHSTHLEAYFGIPAAGGVVHTLNLRLHPDELAFIASHAQDRWLIVDDVLLPIYESFADNVRFERVFVVPFSGLPTPSGHEDYESFVKQGPGRQTLPEVDENAAVAMCYTSGTTGKPKGVAYSHRALVLHALSISLPDNFAMSRMDTVLPAMSMFHANAWGLPHAAVMNGCKLVFPGPNLQPEALLELLSSERVTLTGAVPTVWLGVIDCLERDPGRWKLQEGLRIIVAGSAAPESLFRRFDKFGVRVIQPWGMTETTPIATTSTLKPEMGGWDEDRKYEIRAKQGLPSPLVEMRAVGDDGEIPWDGKTFGELQVRGPFITARYFNLPEEQDKWTEDGWLRTGDVVTIDPDGYVKITDRTKDLIKSGGEWISSVDLENALVGHPAIKEAAVVAIPHPKWQERPLACIVLKDGARVSSQELRIFLGDKFAKWQLPDDFVFLAELPHTSTGKLLKSRLRQQFNSFSWENTGS
ncbi:MAG TPA: long-chain fatty acid--CoA ligase [Terriglobales bacterium]